MCKSSGLSKPETTSPPDADAGVIEWPYNSLDDVDIDESPHNSHIQDEETKAPSKQELFELKKVYDGDQDQLPDKKRSYSYLQSLLFLLPGLKSPVAGFV